MNDLKKWVKPELTLYGDVQTITKGDPPTKGYGGADGAVWCNENVTWGG